MKNIKTFLHSGDCGDIVASLLTVRLLLGEACRARLFLDITGGMEYNGEDIKNALDHPLKFNKNSFDFIKPLLEAQDYIESVQLYSSGVSDRIDFNLNQFRVLFKTAGAHKSTRGGNLDFMHKVAFGFKPEYTGPWLKCLNTGDEKIPVVIGRSTRYQSAHEILIQNVKLWNNAVFIGTTLEYECFKDAMNGQAENLKYYRCRNALDAANVISRSSLFCCNGTLFYWIAVGLGHQNIVHELGLNILSTFYENVPGIKYIQGNRIIQIKFS